MKRILLLSTLLIITSCTTISKPREPAQELSSSDCASMKDLRIQPSALTLLTRGAVLNSAEIISDEDSNGNKRNYCRVLGTIQSRDASAPDIHVQINLPLNWNQKALQMGGGGYNGSIVTGLSHVSFSSTEGPTPLALGYMTFGSDSGHTGSAIDASFAINDEALLNFGSQHLKKTRDLAIVTAQLFYNKFPTRTYFAGASTGGREALTVLQRWPDDYDGVIASAPALNFTGVRLDGLRIGKALYSKNGFLSLKKQDLVFQASIKACDKLDNLEDGIISNVEACKKISAQTLVSLRCKGGADLGDSCLSDAQINSVNVIRTPFNLSYVLADDIRGHEGYNILEGADFRGDWGMGSSSVLNDPLTLANGYLFLQGSQWAQNFMAQEPWFEIKNFDPENPNEFTDRVITLSHLVGATDPHIERFLAKSGKLILMHGLADAMISPNPTITYYEKLIEIFGKEKIQNSVQFYLVPGAGHGNGVFTLGWDPLSALDNWVIQDKRPEILVGKDLNESTRSRQRPLCPYPAWPRYKGSGSVSETASFTCETTVQIK